MLIYPSKIEKEYGGDLTPKQYGYNNSWYYYHRCIDMIDLNKLIYNYFTYSKSEVLRYGWPTCTGMVIRLITIIGKNRAITADMSMRQNKKNIKFLMNYIQSKIHSLCVKERSPFLYSRFFMKNRTPNFVGCRHYKPESYTMGYSDNNHGRIVLKREEKIAQTFPCFPKIFSSAYSIPSSIYNSKHRRPPKDKGVVIGVLYINIYSFNLKPLTEIVHKVKEADVEYHGTSI